MLKRLSAQERVRLAQSIARKVRRPGLSPEQRREGRRHIHNLLRLNAIEAEQRKN